LILVAWVGARSYNSVQALLEEKQRQTAAPELAALPVDPLEQELARHRQELAEAQARLLDQLRQLGDVKVQHHQKKLQLASLINQRQEIERQGRGWIGCWQEAIAGSMPKPSPCRKFTIAAGICSTKFRRWRSCLP